jgi:hypothetical protein
MFVTFNHGGNVRLNLMGPKRLPSFVNPTPCKTNELLGSLAIALLGFGINANFMIYDHVPI